MADQHQHHSGTGDNIGRDKIIHNYHHPTPSPIIPRDQPALDDHFLGRDNELAELLDALHPGEVVTVCGPGGMGKSALAAQAVHQLMQEEPTRFPDGIVFHTFYGHPKTDQALQSIIRAFGLEPEPPLDITLQRVLSGKKALLILDGAEDAHDLPAVLNLRGSCGVLITSRSPRDAQFTQINLHPLGDKSAKVLLLAWSGQAIDDETMQRICTVLGGLPVAVRIAGHYLRSTGESVTEYLNWLEKEPLQELDQGEHRKESVAVLLRRSVEQVSDDARLVLELAGCLAFAPIAREPITALLTGEERPALNELVSFGLLEHREERWQVSHALVHTYARTELAMSCESLKWIVWYYISFYETLSEAGVEGYARLDKERAHYLRLTESSLECGLLAEVGELVKAIDNYLERQGWWTERQTALNMNLTAVRQLGDLESEASCLNSLGYSHESCGNYLKSLQYYKQSLAICRELGQKEGEGATLNNISSIYYAQGNDAQALSYLKQSFAIHQKIGDTKGEGASLNNLAVAAYAKKDYAAALEYLEQSLIIKRESGNRAGEGVTLNNISAIYYAQGNDVQAFSCLEQSLEIQRDIGDKAGEADVCLNIGIAYIKQDELNRAEEYFSHAAQLAEEIGHPDTEKYRRELKRIRALLNNKLLLLIWKSMIIPWKFLRTVVQGAQGRNGRS